MILYYGFFLSLQTLQNEEITYQFIDIGADRDRKHKILQGNNLVKWLVRTRTRQRHLCTCMSSFFGSILFFEVQQEVCVVWMSKTWQTTNQWDGNIWGHNLLRIKILVIYIIVKTEFFQSKMQSHRKIWGDIGFQGFILIYLSYNRKQIF